MKINNIDTGKYSREILEKTSKIEAKAKSRKTRRLIFLGIILFVCLGGIFIGVSNRSKSIETQYKNYIETPNRSALNNELLSYKGVSEQFETTCLGNKACQSLMGGFFYDGTDFSVYPDEAGTKMMLCSADKEITLCDGLASDINVKDGFVYYRKLNTREILSSNISDGTTAELPMKNVGQFIICEDELYYIDLSSSALIAFDIVTAESNEIIHSGVSSFIVIGNNIIFLDGEHTLCELNLSNHSYTKIGGNISEFSYNGKLWIQNNKKVYNKPLDKKAIKDFTFDIQCNRLLGISGTRIYVESEDGIYVYGIEASAGLKLAEGIFVGASDERILVYDSSDDIYQVIAINKDFLQRGQ